MTTARPHGLLTTPVPSCRPPHQDRQQARYIGNAARLSMPEKHSSARKITHPCTRYRRISTGGRGGRLGRMPACTSGCPYNRRVGVKVTAVPDRFSPARNGSLDLIPRKDVRSHRRPGHGRTCWSPLPACRLTATVDSNVVGSGGTESAGVGAQPSGCGPGRAVGTGFVGYGSRGWGFESLRARQQIRGLSAFG